MAKKEKDKDRVLKLLAKADSLARDRKYKKACSVFKQAIEADPNDIKTRLRMSELLFQIGQKEESLKTLQFVGDYYRDNGFLLKSVAVYKKMVEVDPARTELHGMLAQLYFQLGMAPDAIRQFKAQIRAMNRAGKQVESLHVVRSMLELDPSNIVDRIRLAESFSAHGLIDEAANDYRRGLTLLDKSGRVELWSKVALRYLHHAPEDLPVRKRAVDFLLAQGEHHRALQHLHACLTREPRDIDLLQKTAICFRSLGQVDKAIITLKALVPLFREKGLEKEEQDAWVEVLKLDPKDEHALRVVDRSVSDTVEPVEVELEWEMPGSSSRPAIPEVEEVSEEADTVFESGAGAAANDFLQDDATLVQPVSQDLLAELGFLEDEQPATPQPARKSTPPPVPGKAAARPRQAPPTARPKPVDLARVAAALNARKPLTAAEIVESGLPVSDSDREELDFFLSAGLNDEALSILGEIYNRAARGGKKAP
jgi:tetratricopeptide (TPR) repeat protein